MARRRRSRTASGPDRGAPQPTLRVIGGHWRSRRLPIVDRPGLRPTPDRVRETLFNWVAPRLAGAVCCDLFAGTGALGIEALSRGAAHVTFIESDEAAVAGIRDTLETLGAGDRATVLRGDATRAAERLTADSLELVFIDPPFAASLHGAALDGLAGTLRPGARVYLEYPLDEADTLHARLAPSFEILRTKQAAGVGFCLITPQTVITQPFP